MKIPRTRSIPWPKQPLRPAKHHWWPRGLSQYWTDERGDAHQLTPDGKIVHRPPASFAAITDAHRLKRAAPWDSSFESFFDEPDREFANLVDWLLTLETRPHATGSDLHTRMQPNLWGQPERHRLAICVASLLARSPMTRNLIRLTTEYYRGKFGFVDPSADKTLIAANQRGLFDFYSEIMERRGRFAILVSDNVELIFGDGIFNNFPTIVMNQTSNVKAICAILPTIAVAFTCPVSYAIDPSLPVMRLDDAEALLLNETVLTYSKDFVFYRSRHPGATATFSQAEHLQFDEHHHPVIERLLHNVAQYRPRGKTRELPSGNGPFVA